LAFCHASPAVSSFLRSFRRGVRSVPSARNSASRSYADFVDHPWGPAPHPVRATKTTFARELVGAVTPSWRLANQRPLRLRERCREAAASVKPVPLRLAGANYECIVCAGESDATDGEPRSFATSHTGAPRPSEEKQALLICGTAAIPAHRLAPALVVFAFGFRTVSALGGVSGSANRASASRLHYRCCWRFHR